MVNVSLGFVPALRTMSAFLVTPKWWEIIDIFILLPDRNTLLKVWSATIHKHCFLQEENQIYHL